MMSLNTLEEAIRREKHIYEKNRGRPISKRLGMTKERKYGSEKERIQATFHQEQLSSISTRTINTG
jgi:hypothetical protein